MRDVLLYDQLTAPTEMTADDLRGAVFMFLFSAIEHKATTDVMADCLAAGIKMIHELASLEFMAHLKRGYETAGENSPTLDEAFNVGHKKVLYLRTNIITQLEDLMKCRDPETQNVH
jgi:hypothetical protein